MIRAAALVSAAVVCAACGLWSHVPRKVPVNYFLADPRDFDTVRRVMVLPFGEARDVHSNARQVRMAFVNEVAKLGRFEVVPLPESATEHEEIHASVTRGKLSAAALVALSKRYEIDGVLVGTITSYRAYPPMNLGLRLQIVSLHSGRTVWAAEGIYDANDALILGDIEHYAATFAATEASMHGWEINLIAPGKFASFVSHRLVATCR